MRFITDPTEITTIGIKVAKEGFEKACRETKEIMTSKAPKPGLVRDAGGKVGGKGSMSTGKTRGSIKITMDGEYKAFIGPDTEYAYFAENGRKAISKPYYMRFRGADGRIHRAKFVKGMEGWHFVRDTAEEIKEKYGV